MPSLGEQLDYLEGILGYAFKDSHFQNTRLAKYLNITPEQMSRKKKGAAAVTPKDLSRLTEYFQLAPELTFEVFMLPDMDAFKQALQAAKIGTFGLNARNRMRQRLLQDDRHQSGGIRIRRIAAKLRGGGLGLHRNNETSVPLLRTGDQAELHIDVPGEGFLLVLNDCLRSEITCLLPSCFGPKTKVMGGTVRLPADDGSKPLLDVSRPSGDYRIFAIWSEMPLRLRWLSPKLGDEEPKDVDAPELRELAETLDRMKAANGHYLIRSADYEVID